MCLSKTRIICLKRGYLAPNEGNLTSKFRYGRALLDHPVECVNVFLESCHIVRMDLQHGYQSNDQAEQNASSAKKDAPQPVGVSIQIVNASDRHSIIQPRVGQPQGRRAAVLP